jgi:hypothetical protein
MRVETDALKRNMDFGFYPDPEKNDFRPLATARWNGAEAVFMGRLLRPR